MKSLEQALSQYDLCHHEMGKCEHSMEGSLREDTGRRQPFTNQRERPREKVAPPTPRSQICSFQDCEKINFCCLCHPLCTTWLQQPHQTRIPQITQQEVVVEKPLAAPSSLLCLPGLVLTLVGFSPLLGAPGICTFGS